MSGAAERIAGFHGSQCGFCTPGMVVSCHTALTNAHKNGKSCTATEMEKAFDGNLCRCTGYRPILDACKVTIRHPVSHFQHSTLLCKKDAVHTWTWGTSAISYSRRANSVLHTGVITPDVQDCSRSPFLMPAR